MFHKKVLHELYVRIRVCNTVINLHKHLSDANNFHMNRTIIRSKTVKENFNSSVSDPDSDLIQGQMDY
jgi:hypothetical protein